MKPRHVAVYKMIRQYGDTDSPPSRAFNYYGVLIGFGINSSELYRGGIGHYTIAIVETLDGNIESEPLSNIKFIEKIND